MVKGAVKKYFGCLDKYFPEKLTKKQREAMKK